MVEVMEQSILVVIFLFAIAGGGIIVIDWLIIRRLRKGDDDRIEQ
jgi:hypothetical protein